MAVFLDILRDFFQRFARLGQNLVVEVGSVEGRFELVLSPHPQLKRGEKNERSKAFKQTKLSVWDFEFAC